MICYIILTNCYNTTTSKKITQAPPVTVAAQDIIASQIRGLTLFMILKIQNNNLVKLSIFYAVYGLLFAKRLFF